MLNEFTATCKTKQYNEATLLPLKLRFSYPTVVWGVSEPQHNKCDDYKDFRLNIIFSLTFAHNRKCLYLLEKRKDAPAKKFHLFVYVKWHLPLHTSAHSLTTESNWLQFCFMNLKWPVFYHLTIKFFKCSIYLTWQWILKVSAEEKLPLQINCIHLTACGYLRVSVGIKLSVWWENSTACFSQTFL